MSIEVQPGGRLVIDDAWLAADAIVVANGGVLEIAGASSVLAVHDLILGPQASLIWLAGTIEVSGLFDMTASLLVGVDGPATLMVVDEAQVVATTVHIGWYGLLSGRGLVTANVINEGLVSPQTGGTVTIDGDYRQTPDGQLLFEQGTLAIAGVADLAGVLDVPEFDRVQGEILVLLEALVINGWFDRIDSPTFEVREQDGLILLESQGDNR